MSFHVLFLVPSTTCLWLSCEFSCPFFLVPSTTCPWLSCEFSCPFFSTVSNLSLVVIKNCAISNLPLDVLFVYMCVCVSCAVNNLPLVIHWVLVSLKKKSFNYKRIMSASRALQMNVTGVCFWNWVLSFVTSFISNALRFECGHVWTRCWEPVCVMLAQFSMHCWFFADGLMLSFLCSFVSLSLGLSACNSSGHLSNHAEIAPSYAGITFAISNTLVSCLPVSLCLSLCVCPLQHCL